MYVRMCAFLHMLLKIYWLVIFIKYSGLNV